VGPLAAAALGEAALLLARAFRDNPLNAAVIRSASPARRLRCNAASLRALLPVALAHGEVWEARLSGQLAGVLLGTAAHAYPLPPPRPAARLRALLGQGLGVAQRWAAVFARLDGLHPREPHRYLGTVGVAPDQRRRGVGTALVRHWCGLADRERVPVYLETDVPGNVPFYEREGFSVLDETDVLGTAVWRMRRAAR
jgi:GNAT superfamily N-acetyltransferase